MHSYEIEIKSLLGTKEKAEKLKAKMQKHPAGLKSLGSHKQLNHYFIGNNTALLSRIAVKHIPQEKQEQFKKVLENSKEISVRTRQADKKVIFVIKATVDDTTSSNGTARLEFESDMDMSLAELDQLILKSGFEYQAKWSREREDFKFKDLNVSIDKNAGYGYLAEFEKVIADPTEADAVKQLIRSIMLELEVDELMQDRLERMFAHYNQNWQDYYGTDKTFTIE